MYGIYADIWGILMFNVTIYSIHGSSGYMIIIIMIIIMITIMITVLIVLITTCVHIYIYIHMHIYTHPAAIKHGNGRSSIQTVS